jgi:hypothetical protein
MTRGPIWGNRNRTKKSHGYGFFSKKNILIPNVAEKNILILVGVWQFL